jgi:uncharacterized protein (DUF362 family)
MRRRDFLKRTVTMTGGIAAGYVLNLTGCVESSPCDESVLPDGEFPDDSPLRAGDVLLGLYASSDITRPEDAVRHSLARVDFDWLTPGDTVFVKLSSNSGRVHPAVTSPAAVTGLCAELFERGAGRVIVGDQAGVESVRLVEGETRFGSTQALMEGNGLYEAITAAGAEPHFFDDQSYASGYFEATLPVGHHWKEPLMLARIIEQVDHIVYLPRLSSHSLAGYAHGLKTAVGWLRDDSRYHMHNDAASLHEKYVEVSYTAEIASRLRLVLTFAEQLMLHQGPDTGTIAFADPRIVVASDNIANHDALSAALLRQFDTTTRAPISVSNYGDGRRADARNEFFVTTHVENATGIPWGQGGEGYTRLQGHRYWEGISADHGLSRAYELEGGIPNTIQVRRDGAPLHRDLICALSTANGGIFNFQ